MSVLWLVFSHAAVLSEEEGALVLESNAAAAVETFVPCPFDRLKRSKLDWLFVKVPLEWCRVGKPLVGAFLLLLLFGKFAMERFFRCGHADLMRFLVV